MHHPKKLRRELGFWDAVATGIAAMIGAGIFVVSGMGAKLAGPSVIAAFFIGGLVALLSAFSSAELAAAIPREGATYEYARRLISKRVGYATGWLFLSSKLLESATVALAFGAYASLFLGFDFRILAIVSVAALTAINIAGIRATTGANKLFAFIKVAILASFAFMGAGAVKPANFEPFAPSGFGGLLAAAGITFFAYTGYARIATMGEEVKNPRKTIPKAILVSLAITAAIYISVVTVGIGLIGAKEFSESASPIASAASALGIPAIVALVGFGAGIATLSVVLGDLLVSSRMMFSMAREHDLPHSLSDLKHSNPENAILASAAIVLALTMLGNIFQIAAFTSLTILLYYAVTNISSINLPENKRMFPKPFAIAGAASCLLLAASLPLEQWLWTTVLVAIGLAYAALRKRKF